MKSDLSVGFDRLRARGLLIEEPRCSKTYGKPKDESVSKWCYLSSCWEAPASLNFV